LERPEREKEEAPKKLLKALDLKPGMSIADIGAGSGYYTFRMSEIVGEKGKVFAVDIQPEMLAIMKRKAGTLRANNIDFVLNTTTDAKLPPKSVELILMVDVYHEFSHPWEMVRSMIPALKEKGRIVFVEFRAEDPKVPIKEVHKMTEAQVKKEMSVHPLTHVATLDPLPWQHIVVFEKKVESPEPPK
jgi:ubiquinone/menaquinone biosynthesis C-methylase UbiE